MLRRNGPVIKPQYPVIYDKAVYSVLDSLVSSDLFNQSC